MDVVDALAKTFDHTRGVIANVGPDQLDGPTPCSEWTVRDLMAHLIGVVDGLGASAAGRTPTPFELGADPAGQFDAIAATAITAWRAPGVLARVLESPAGAVPGHVLAGINLLDTATHAWDLATATGQPAMLPVDVATAALEASHAIVNDDLRAGRFGPEVVVPDGADATARLVGFLGRTPA